MAGPWPTRTGRSAGLRRRAHPARFALVCVENPLGGAVLRGRCKSPGRAGPDQTEPGQSWGGPGRALGRPQLRGPGRGIRKYWPIVCMRFAGIFTFRNIHFSLGPSDSRKSFFQVKIGRVGEMCKALRKFGRRAKRLYSIFQRCNFSVVFLPSSPSTLYIWISESLWDSVNFHWISVSLI